MQDARDLMTPLQAGRFVAKHGVVLESANGPVPSLLEAALGRRPRGSWWADPEGKAFFWLTRAMRARSDILVCRLVSGKITYVHRRVWPALTRLRRRFKASALAAVHETHTMGGAHRTTQTPIERRLPQAVFAAGARLTPAEASRALGPVFEAGTTRPAIRGTT